jgi:hypothetical protein
VLSLFDLIREQQSADPSRSLDYGRFPEVTSIGSVHFAPGARDALSGRFGEKPDHWQDVKALIVSLKSGRVSSSKLEQSLRAFPAAPNVDAVLGHISPDDVPGYVTRAFWNVAKKSRDYEAVKWGIAIGSLRLPDEAVPELLTFARHSELTVYAVVGLLNASAERPELKSYLPPLLAMTDGWGTVRLVDFIGRDKILSSKADVVRAVTIYGVENCAGLLVEVGHKIARQLNPEVFALAASDARLFVAIVTLMEEILTTDHPLGGILDVPEPKTLVEAHFQLLSSRKSDIWVLQGMRTARNFFDDPDCPFDNRMDRSVSLSLMLKERMSADIIRNALADMKTRWIALQIIDQDRMLECMPDLETTVVDSPTSDVIRILGRQGDSRQRQLLLDLLPRVVDFRSRANRPFSATNVQWPERDECEWEYAAIVGIMGAVASQESIRMLKVAIADFNPLIRNAACETASLLPRDRVDEELVELLNERAEEKLDYVRTSAESAIARLRQRS